ncbi:hypothetical protein ACHAWF_002179, partial [Thalassiosira exigua]
GRRIVVGFASRSSPRASALRRPRCQTAPSKTKAREEEVQNAVWSPERAVVRPFASRPLPRILRASANATRDGRSMFDLLRADLRQQTADEDRKRTPRHRKRPRTYAAGHSRDGILLDRQGWPLSPESALEQKLSESKVPVGSTAKDWGVLVEVEHGCVHEPAPLRVLLWNKRSQAFFYRLRCWFRPLTARGPPIRDRDRGRAGEGGVVPERIRPHSRSQFFGFASDKASMRGASGTSTASRARGSSRSRKRRRAMDGTWGLPLGRALVPGGYPSVAECLSAKPYRPRASSRLSLSPVQASGHDARRRGRGSIVRLSGAFDGDSDRVEDGTAKVVVRRSQFSYDPSPRARSERWQTDGNQSENRAFRSIPTKSARIERPCKSLSDTFLFRHNSISIVSSDLFQEARPSLPPPTSIFAAGQGIFDPFRLSMVLFAIRILK